MSSVLKILALTFWVDIGIHTVHISGQDEVWSFYGRSRPQIFDHDFSSYVTAAPWGAIFRIDISFGERGREGSTICKSPY